MSGKKKTIVRVESSPARQDRRVRRTRSRLALAIRQLIQQKPLQQIIVQDVLDQAGVSRSAFYAHYSDTQDLFLSDMDQFLQLMATCLSRAAHQSERLFPVQEFFAHVGEAEPLRLALARSDRLSDFYDLAREHFARGIEQRLSEIPRSGALPRMERSALAHALAGAMLSQLDWWLRQRKRLSPEQMDRNFHRFAWAGITSALSGYAHLRKRPPVPTPAPRLPTGLQRH